MKRTKKTVSVILAMALCFTALYAGFTIPASATAGNGNDSIINGDFSTNTLFGYDVSDNVINSEQISVSDGVCYIPAFVGDTSNDDKSYNRFVNQRVALSNGKYIFSFDVDATFGSAENYNFTYVIRRADEDCTNLQTPYMTGYKRPRAASVPGTDYTISSPTVNASAILNTSNLTEPVSLNSNDFFESGVNFWYLKGAANNRYTGRISVTIDVNNTEAESTDFWFSIGLNGFNDNIYAYIDNISLERVTVFNGDFSAGLTGYDVSANMTHAEAMTVTNGVCYIPTVTSTIDADKPYNRWLNQKVVLENGKYLFSYDLDITYTTASAWSFAHAVRNAENMDANVIRPHSGSANTGFTVDNPTVEALDYVLNTADATVPASLRNFALSNSSKYYNYNGAVGRQVGRVSFVVTVNNMSAETTALYFSIGNYANACSAYIDNISVEKVNIINGDFSAGLTGYDISANRTHAEAMTVTNGVCYIPTVTSTVANDKPYNRWLNQKVVLENGKYLFSYDLDITYTTASAWSFAHAVRNAENMDANIIRPTSGAVYTGITVGNPILEKLDYVLNTADDTSASPITESNFALSNSSKYYNFNGKAAKRYVGRVLFIVDVNNASASTTSLYFSIGNYANACYSYIDNISITPFDGKEIISNGDFEEGETGYLYSDSTSQVEVYNDSDTSRPGYGVAALNGKAAYILGGLDVTAAQRKNYLLQYKMSCLPAGQYTIDMDVALNLLQNDNKLVALAFGVTDAINANGCVYGNRLINSTGTSSNVEFTDYNVSVTEDGTRVPHNKSHLYHRVGSWALGEELGWHNLHVSITFKTTQTKTLYFFAGCAGNAADNMIATAYVDNVSMYSSATMNYMPVNVKGRAISWTTTEFNKLDSIVSREIDNLSNYTIMGYKVGGAGEIVNKDLYEAIVEQDNDITCVYALKGDLNDDLYINDLDGASFIKLLLDKNINCNVLAAKVNDDDVVDIRDYVAFKKQRISAVANDGEIVNVGIDRLRDPYVLLEDGIYYMYGTGGLCYKNTTRSLSGTWQYVGSIVETPAMADGNFAWAPEVYKYNDAYYMITSYHSSVTEHRGCVVFRSDSPEGPFVQISDGTITPADYDCIDGTLYFDNNGQPWLIYSKENETNSIGRMFAARLSADLTSLTTTPIQLFKADDASWSSGTVAEGPCMYRCENGELLMIWSGFQYVNSEYLYCVGIARSNNGEITSNWSCDSNLLYSKDLSGSYDGGHGMVFTSLTGQMYLSVHTPNDTAGVDEKPVLIPIKEENGTLVWDVD